MPDTLDGVKLSPAQAKLFDSCTDKIKGVKDPGAACAENFRRAHRVVGAGKNRRWVIKKESTAKA